MYIVYFQQPYIKLWYCLVYFLDKWMVLGNLKNIKLY